MNDFSDLLAEIVPRYDKVFIIEDLWVMLVSCFLSYGTIRLTLPGEKLTVMQVDATLMS